MNKKILVVIVILAIIAVIMAFVSGILYFIASHDDYLQRISSVISVVSTIISVILSVIATIYSFISGQQTTRILEDIKQQNKLLADYIGELRRNSGMGDSILERFNKPK